VTAGPSSPASSEAVTQQLPAIGATASRAVWVDVLKGVCIVLVVLWHVIMKHYLRVDWHLTLPIPGAWGTFGEVLLPLRMPAFFTVSGMLAAAAVARPWSVVRRARITKFLYLYVLWFVIQTAVLAFVPDFDTLSPRSLWTALTYLTVTPTNLWYLMALPLYFAIAKVSRRWPAWLVLGAALLLSAAGSAQLLAGPGNRGQLYQNLFFFLAGLRCKPVLHRLAETVRARTLGWCAAVYVLIIAAVELLGARQWFGVWPAVSALAVVVGVAGAGRLQHWRRLSGGLAALGRTTLPIYVMHMPLLALAHLLLLKPLSDLGGAAQSVLAPVLPLVLTALLVAVCLCLHRGLQTVDARWLFDLPGRRGAHR
jgi:uncharacterized membrane protein YcfT